MHESLIKELTSQQLFAVSGRFCSTPSWCGQLEVKSRQKGNKKTAKALTKSNKNTTDTEML